MMSEKTTNNNKTANPTSSPAGLFSANTANNPPSTALFGSKNPTNSLFSGGPSSVSPQGLFANLGQSSPSNAGPQLFSNSLFGNNQSPQAPAGKTNDSKTAERKVQVAPSSSLFSPSGLFTSSPSNVGAPSPSLFLKKAQAPLFKATDDQKSQNISLFNFTASTKTPPSATNSNSPQESSQPFKMPQKNTLAAIFRGTSVLIDKSSQGRPATEKSKQKESSTPKALGSLFGNVSPSAIGAEKSKQTKQSQDLQAKAPLPQSSLFGGVKGKQYQGDSKLLLSFGKPKDQQSFSLFKQTQQKLISPPQFSNPGKTQQKKREVSQTSRPLFKKPDEEVLSQEIKATISISSQPTTYKDKQKTGQPFKYDLLKNKPGNQEQFKEAQKKSRSPESDAQKTLISASTEIPQPEINTSKEKQTSFAQKKQDILPQSNKQSAATQSNQSFLSIFKPNEKKIQDFIDFKSLKRSQTQDPYGVFVIGKKSEIIQTIKIFFSLKQGEEKEKELDEKASDKDRFYSDLTNLFIKVNQLEVKHFSAYQKFIQAIMIDEKYEQKIFKDNKFFQSYFLQNAIYINDYGGNLRLNQQSSRELKYLMQKIITKWNFDKANYLNFLFGHPELMRPKEDLFRYLFLYLLKLEQPKQLNQTLTSLKATVRDHNRVASTKLIELLEFYNQKLGKNYKNLLSQQPQNFIIHILPLIERMTNQNAISLSLKIILNSLNLGRAQKLSSTFNKAIQQTKAIALLPFRAISLKLKQGRFQIAPSPKDLYKYINGDQWIDWLDIYLDSGNKHSLQLTLQEVQYITSSISSISGNLLIDRLIKVKRGVFKFFEMLNEQILTEHYFKILQSCVYNQQPIDQIEQFYFKRVYFNSEYQQLKEYVLNFKENIGKPLEELNSHYDKSLLRTLYPKISLISKMIQIEPSRLFIIQRYIFSSEFNDKKMSRFNQNTQIINTQGHRLVHFLIDIINIVSVKWLSTDVLAKVFRALTAMLKTKTTEQIVVTAMSINKPSFKFIQKQELLKETSQALGDLLHHIVSSSYLYDLIINASETVVEEIKMQIFYPLRYNAIQYSKLMYLEQNEPSTFSLYWVDQLFITASKQKFNPQLLQKLLNKFNIYPDSVESQGQTNQFGLRRYRRSQNVPKIFQMIIGLANSFSIWAEINKILQYLVIKDEGSFQIAIKHNNNSQNLQQYKQQLATLKLLKTIYRLNQIYVKEKENNSTHFIIKTLGCLNLLTKPQLRPTMSNSDKSNFLLGLLANIQVQQPLHNDTAKRMNWQFEQKNQDSSDFQQTLNYVKLNKHCLDFEQVSNFVKTPQNMYYQSQDNLTTIALECVIYFLRLNADSCLSFMLVDSTERSQALKAQLKTDLMKNLTNTLIFYCSYQKFKSIKYKIFQFIYDFKYNLGANKLNQDLADSLFQQFLNNRVSFYNDIRLSHIILEYLAKELSRKRQRFQSYSQDILLEVISSFQIMDIRQKSNYFVKGIKQICSLMRKYYDNDFSFLNFNQMERIVEEKAIIQAGETLQTLTLICQMLIHLIRKKRCSASLVLGLQSINGLIISNNLALYTIDIPFEKVNLSLKQFNKERQLRKPRQFLKDPLQLFLCKGKSLQEKQEIQLYQKNNITYWFMRIAEDFSQQITNYLQLVLVIDEKFYSNNPLNFELSSQELKDKVSYIHLSRRSTDLTSTYIIGNIQPVAVGLIHLLAESLIQKLIIIDQNLRELAVSKSFQKINYQQALRLIGFCMQWLRPRCKGQYSVANQIVKQINRNPHILFPLKTAQFCSQQLKLIQSYMSIGQNIPSHIKNQIQGQIYLLLTNYHTLMSEQSLQFNPNLGDLAQQAFSVLMLSPPAANQIDFLQLILSILRQEINQSYFYNECRLVLHLSTLYPETMAQLKVLIKFEPFQSYIHSTDRYENEKRKVDSMKWLWIVRIAGDMASSSDSILVLTQLSKFVDKHKLMLFKTLKGEEKTITRAYLEQLQATLKLFSFLFSYRSWVNFNMQTLEELAYILSHNLSQFFMGICNGQILPFAASVNQKLLENQKISTLYGENQMVEDDEDDLLQSVFGFQIKSKTANCLKFYLLAMEAAFQKSQFIQKYFITAVSETNKYLFSFWEVFGKKLLLLFDFIVQRIEACLRNKRLKELIQLMNHCQEAPHTFLSDGFLPSVTEIPTNQRQVYSELYLLTFLIAKLSVTVFSQQKFFINKFNATNMISQKDNFGLKIRELILKVGELTLRLGAFSQEFVKYNHFKKLYESIDIKLTLK